MALASVRTLAQLEAMCKQFNLEVKPKGKKLKKDDYIVALRQYYLKEYYPNGDLPKDLDLILQVESPMLATQYKEVKPDKQEEMWKSDQWYAEEKEDGNRMVYMFIDGEFSAYGRNNSVKDMLPINYRHNILLDRVDTSKIKHSFILDSEIVCPNPNICTIVGNSGVYTETQLQAVTALLSMNSEDSIRIQREQHVQLNFYTFDCLWYDGEWLLDKPLKERRKYLIQAIQELREAGFKAGLPKSSLKDKKGLYNQIIENGGEGIILKNLESPYHPFTTRSHRNWVKVKRSMSETLKNAGFDYTDAFITGYELASEDKANAGYVGTLIFSVYLLDKNGEIKGLHEIAKISGLTQEMREEITDFIDGEPKLKEEYYGQVWEIDGQAISARSKRFRHAVLVRPRPDRSSDTCQMSEELLNSMVF